MNLKLYYRSPVIWNIVLYIILSLVFIYFQEIYRHASSILVKELFISFVKNNIYILSIFILTILSMFTVYKKLTNLLLISSISLTSILTVMNLMNEFSKFSLIILFIYLLVAFYLIQFYNVDIKESYYNPLFGKNLLFDPMLKQIPVKIYKDDNEIGQGYLTNWSEEGCFIYLEEPTLLKGKVEVMVSYMQSEFKQKAYIVAALKGKNGYGVKFQFNSKKGENLNSLGWKQFYEIIEEMGLKPELLK
ncbi:MAG: hypothetical protein QF441_14625 [Bacteriovoracaceae bacterium]|nr:hypothetical protein [Bacteriovoracaceae bacterium]